MSNPFSKLKDRRKFKKKRFLISILIKLGNILRNYFNDTRSYLSKNVTKSYILFNTYLILKGLQKFENANYRILIKILNFYFEISHFFVTRKDGTM